MTTTVERNQESPTKIRWGAHFKSAREAMHLTEKDIAIRLHLNPSIIMIIESENFENAPPTIFMRGYIRSYARILNMSEKHINQALNDLGLAGEDTAKPSPMMRPKKIQDSSGPNYTRWSTSFVVLVLAGLVGMWWNTHAHNNPDGSTNSNSSIAMQNSTNSPSSNTPGDPTPKELAGPFTPAPGAVASGSPVAKPNVAQAAPALAPGTPETNPKVAAAPQATEDQAPEVASTTPPTTAQPTVAKPAAPLAPESGNPVASADPTATAQPDADGNIPAANPALAEEDPLANPDEDAKPVPPKKHLARNHHHQSSDMAQEEMAVPEPGLVPEPGSDPSDN